MSIDLANASAYLDMAASKVATPEGDTPLFVLGSKASSNDAALRITDVAMRACVAEQRFPSTCGSTATSAIRARAT